MLRSSSEGTRQFLNAPKTPVLSKRSQSLTNLGYELTLEASQFQETCHFSPTVARCRSLLVPASQTLPTIAVGPVIGKITDTSARVLLELDANCAVECLLFTAQPDNPATYQSKAVHRQVVPFHKGHPKIVIWSTLHPNTDYKMEVLGVSLPLQSSSPESIAIDRTAFFRTFPQDKEISSLRVVGLCCDDLDFPFRNSGGPFDLWTILWRDWVLPNRVDLFIHHGDQVYADPAFDRGLEIIKESEAEATDDDCSRQKRQKVTGVRNQSNHQSTNEVDDAVLEEFKQFYRCTWNNPPTQRVLARVQHLMIWDDHEVRNDWGSLNGDCDSSLYRANSSQEGLLNPVTRVALQARKAYWLYQRQLWDDLHPDLGSPAQPELEAHYHRWGPFALLLLDSRTSRTFSCGRPLCQTIPEPQDPAMKMPKGDLLGEQRQSEDFDVSQPPWLHHDQAFFGSDQWQLLDQLLGHNQFSCVASDHANSRPKANSDSNRNDNNSQGRAESPGWDTVRAMVVVTTQPAVFLGAAESQLVLSKFECLRDKLGVGLHPHEQRALLSLLTSWRDRFPEKPRDVLLLGGDLHFTVESLITVPLESTPEGDMLSRAPLRQIVTGAVSNQPIRPRSFDAWRNNCRLQSQNRFPSRTEGTNDVIEFAHTRFTNNLSFASINMQANVPQGENLISTELFCPSLEWIHNPSARSRD